MLHILGFLFFIVLIIFVIGVVILAKIVRTVTVMLFMSKFLCSSLFKFMKKKS